MAAQVAAGTTSKQLAGGQGIWHRPIMNIKGTFVQRDPRVQIALDRSTTSRKISIEPFMSPSIWPSVAHRHDKG